MITKDRCDSKNIEKLTTQIVVERPKVDTAPPWAVVVRHHKQNLIHGARTENGELSDISRAWNYIPKKDNIDGLVDYWLMYPYLYQRYRGQKYWICQNPRIKDHSDWLQFITLLQTGIEDMLSEDDWDSIYEVICILARGFHHGGAWGSGIPQMRNRDKLAHFIYRYIASSLNWDEGCNKSKLRKLWKKVIYRTHQGRGPVDKQADNRRRHDAAMLRLLTAAESFKDQHGRLPGYNELQKITGSCKRTIKKFFEGGMDEAQKHRRTVEQLTRTIEQKNNITIDSHDQILGQTPTPPESEQEKTKTAPDFPEFWEEPIKAYEKLVELEKLGLYKRSVVRNTGQPIEWEMITALWSNRITRKIALGEVTQRWIDWKREQQKKKQREKQLNKQARKVVSHKDCSHCSAEIMFLKTESGDYCPVEAPGDDPDLYPDAGTYFDPEIHVAHNNKRCLGLIRKRVNWISEMFGHSSAFLKEFLLCTDEWVVDLEELSERLDMSIDEIREQLTSELSVQ